MREQRHLSYVANTFFNFVPRDQVDLRTDQERRQDEALEDVSSILGAPRDILNGISGGLDRLSKKLGDIAVNSDNPFVSALANAGAFTTSFGSGVYEGAANIVGVLDVPTVVKGVKQNYKLYAKHGIGTYEATVLMFHPGTGLLEAYFKKSFQAHDFPQELDGWDRAGRGIQSFFDTAGTVFGGLAGIRGAAGRLNSISSKLDDLFASKLDDLGERALGGNAGHRYAAEVIDGGSGRAFAGHGRYRLEFGETVVPEGTSITLPRHDARILDRTGRFIENADWDGLRAAAGRDPRIARDIQGMATHLPGARIHNYELLAPTNHPRPLRIFLRSTTVEDATPLSRLLESNIYHCDWAACTELW